MFLNMKDVKNTRIGLPNQFIIHIEMVGDIKFNDKLILNEVLCVPQFEQNLVYVTPLTAHYKELTVELYYNHVVIQ